MKEFKGDTRDGESYHVLGLIFKMTTVLREIYKFNAIPIKLLTAFFTKLKINFKICIETLKSPNSQHNPEKKKKMELEEIRLPNLRLKLQESNSIVVLLFNHYVMSSSLRPHGL